MPHLALGSTFDIGRPDEARPSCFSDYKVVTMPSRNPAQERDNARANSAPPIGVEPAITNRIVRGQVEFDLRRIESRQELFRFLDIRASFSGRIGIVSGSGSFHQLSEMRFSESSMIVGLRVTITGEQQTLDAFSFWNTPSPTPPATRPPAPNPAQLSAQRALVRQRCGTHVVLSQTLGGEVFLLFELMGTSRYEREVLEASLSASARGGFWSAQASASFTQIMTQFMLNRRVRIYTFVNGSTPLNNLVRTMTNQFFNAQTDAFNYDVIRDQFIDFGRLVVAQGVEPGGGGSSEPNPLLPIRYQVGPLDALLERQVNPAAARLEGLMEEALLSYRQVADTRRTIDDWLRAIGATAAPGGGGLGASGSATPQPPQPAPVCAPSGSLPLRLTCYRAILTEAMVDLQEFSGSCAAALSQLDTLPPNAPELQAPPDTLRRAAHGRSSTVAIAGGPAPTPAPLPGGSPPPAPAANQVPARLPCTLASLRGVLDEDPGKLPIVLMYSQLSVNRPAFSGQPVLQVVPVGDRVEVVFQVQGEGLAAAAVLDVRGEPAYRERRPDGTPEPEDQRIRTNVFLRTVEPSANNATRRALIWLSYRRDLRPERFPLFVQVEEFGGRQTLLPLVIPAIPPPGP